MQDEDLRLCILCGHDQLSTLKDIPVSTLNNLYALFHKLETKDTFKDILELSLLHCQSCKCEFFYPLVSGDAKFYKELNKFYWYYPKTKMEFTYAADLLKSSRSILDIGSGKGHFAALFDQGVVTSIDFDEENTTEEELLEKLKDFAGEYDAITCFQFLEHLKNPKKMVKVIRSLLKKDGKFIFSVPDKESYLKKIPYFPLNLPPHHLSYWSEQSIERLSKLWGFESFDVQKFDVEEWEYEAFSLSQNLAMSELVKSVNYQFKVKLLMAYIKGKLRHHKSTSVKGSSLFAVLVK